MSRTDGEPPMIRHTSWIGVALAAGIMALPAWARDSRALGEGIRLLSARDDAAAGALWLRSADAAMAVARDAATRRDGCLLYVVATLAFERAADTQAYASWGRAVRCYAAAGTTWDTERARLAGRVQQVDEGLRVFAGREGGGPVPEETAPDAELVALARLVPLATYEGPALTLSPPASAPEHSTETPVVPLAGPRPPAGVEEGTAPSTAPAGAPAGVLPRGVVPRRAPPASTSP